MFLYLSVKGRNLCLGNVWGIFRHCGVEFLLSRDKRNQKRSLKKRGWAASCRWQTVILTAYRKPSKWQILLSGFPDPWRLITPHLVLVRIIGKEFGRLRLCRPNGVRWSDNEGMLIANMPRTFASGGTPPVRLPAGAPRSSQNILKNYPKPLDRQAIIC